MGFAQLLEDIEEGECRMVDVEEIKTKQGNLMVNWKRKSSSASSNCILDVVEPGEGNKIVSLENHQNHYERYYKEWFSAGEQKEGSETTKS